MLQSFVGTGNPHRDIDGPHYTFQMNFWFPLHRVEEGSSLLLFPDIYTKDVLYQQQPANPRDPDSWGYGKPVCRAMDPGDIVLFHSQHFHASPTRNPTADRLTVELRVGDA
jgi:ectoine hydroxylase-related dioxygenase (phytanoyl-CoA dioxygenase family)